MCWTLEIPWVEVNLSLGNSKGEVGLKGNFPGAFYSKIDFQGYFK